MFKIAVIVWIMLATVMAGVSLLVVVSVPELSADAARLIPIACGAAALVAVPLSYLIAWRIKAQAVG
jgi:hypothetical protein